MRYFKSRKSDDYADLLQGSKFMQQVSRPDGLNTGDVTTQRYRVIEHPDGGEFALVVPETDDINVHTIVATLAQGSGNFPDQESFINNDAESARIKALIRDNPRVLGYLLAPGRWTERTQEEMEAEGWFNEAI